MMIRTAVRRPLAWLWSGPALDDRLKRRIGRRLLAAALISSLLSLLVTTIIEFRQLVEEVVLLVSTEVDRMTHPTAGTAMASPADLAEALIREHFLSAELYGPDRTVLAHALRKGSSHQAALKAILADDVTSPLPTRKQPHTSLHIADWSLFLKVTTPAMSFGHGQTGFLEGVYEVEEETAQTMIGEILLTWVEVLFGVLATTAVLYPAVLSVSAELVQRNAELAEVNAAYEAKGNFIAAMSHELRSPLNAVIGFAEVMRLELLGPLGNAKYRDYCDDIHLSGNHLLALINDVLDMAKIEAGKLELQEETVDMATVLDTCRRLTEMRFRQKGSHLTVHAQPGLGLRGDGRKITQILLNLMTNAAKFTGANQTVTVSAELRDGAVVLGVADTGVGIAPQDIPLVLSPYGQTGHHEGTGLGLPLSKRLAELHGGTLTIDSALGVGTTVTVTFPAERTLTASSVTDGPSAQC